MRTTNTTVKNSRFHSTGCPMQRAVTVLYLGEPSMPSISSVSYSKVRTNNSNDSHFYLSTFEQNYALLLIAVYLWAYHMIDVVYSVQINTERKAILICTLLILHICYTLRFSLFISHYLINLAHLVVEFALHLVPYGYISYR